MICEKCKKREAAVHYTQNVNGIVTKTHLCPECAKEAGLSLGEEQLFSPLLSLFGTRTRESEGIRCPLCHSTREEIRRSGKFGCSACYDTFGSSLDLTPFIGKGYGGAPLGAGTKTEAKNTKETKEETPVEQWKRELKEAVEREDYEKAARLRDKIRREEEK